VSPSELHTLLLLFPRVPTPCPRAHRQGRGAPESDGGAAASPAQAHARRAPHCAHPSARDARRARGASSRRPLSSLSLLLLLIIIIVIIIFFFIIIILFIIIFFFIIFVFFVFFFLHRALICCCCARSAFSLKRPSSACLLLLSPCEGAFSFFGGRAG